MAVKKIGNILYEDGKKFLGGKRFFTIEDIKNMMAKRYDGGTGGFSERRELFKYELVLTSYVESVILILAGTPPKGYAIYRAGAGSRDLYLYDNNGLRWKIFNDVVVEGYEDISHRDSAVVKGKEFLQQLIHNIVSKEYSAPEIADKVSSIINKINLLSQDLDELNKQVKID